MLAAVAAVAAALSAAVALSTADAATLAAAAVAGSSALHPCHAAGWVAVHQLQLHRQYVQHVAGPGDSYHVESRRQNHDPRPLP